MLISFASTVDPDLAVQYGGPLVPSMLSYKNMADSGSMYKYVISLARFQFYRKHRLLIPCSQSKHSTDIHNLRLLSRPTLPASNSSPPSRIALFIPPFASRSIRLYQIISRLHPHRSIQFVLYCYSQCRLSIENERYVPVDGRRQKEGQFGEEVYY